MTRGGGNRVDTTQPNAPVRPGEIQVRRCHWMIWHGPNPLIWKHCGYLIIVGPGRRYWRPTRRAACGLAQRIRSQTIEA